MGVRGADDVPIPKRKEKKKDLIVIAKSPFLGKEGNAGEKSPITLRALDVLSLKQFERTNGPRRTRRKA